MRVQAIVAGVCFVVGLVALMAAGVVSIYSKREVPAIPHDMD